MIKKRENKILSIFTQKYFFFYSLSDSCVRFQHILYRTLSACDWKNNARLVHHQSAFRTEPMMKQQQKQQKEEERFEAARQLSKKPKAMGSENV